jgi:hypothetical protein
MRESTSRNQANGSTRLFGNLHFPKRTLLEDQIEVPFGPFRYLGQVGLRSQVHVAVCYRTIPALGLREGGWGPAPRSLYRSTISDRPRCKTVWQEAGEAVTPLTGGFSKLELFHHTGL